MTLYDITVPTFIKTLQNLDTILDKAAKNAEARKFETSVLMDARLAPDMLNFVRQIQIACDTAKLCVSRLTGKDAPVNDDKETTLADLKTRIGTTLSYLKDFSAKDFIGTEDKKITTPRWEGKWLTGTEYATQHALPNIFFHVTTAYAILRHNGVDIGKKDYLGEMPYKN
jgi:hypothetical protein